MIEPLPKRIGPYEIVEALGEGPVGRVFKARRDGAGVSVALKVMTEGEPASKESLDRFLRDSRRAADLHHPGIVPIHDIGVEGNVRYVALEWVAEGSLAAVLRRGPLEPLEALRICLEAAEVLRAAHERGLVHGNLKPSNLILDGNRRATIADFGMALAPEEDEQATRTGGAADIPVHRSPEQVFGSPDEVDKRTDVYSLASIFYEMLTGRPPFDGPDPFSVLKRIELEEPAPPSVRRPGLGTALDVPILRALEKDPARRTASVTEFALALRAATKGARPAVGRKLLGLVAGVAAVAALVFLGSQWSLRPDSLEETAHRRSVALLETGSLREAIDLSRGAIERGFDTRVSRLHRLYALFLRHGVIEGNTRISYLAAAVPLDLDRELETLKSLGASPEELALAEAIRHSLAGRFREAEERSRGSGDRRAAVVRRNALLRLPPAPVDEPPRGWVETLLAALAAARAGREEEALRLADAMVAVAPRPTADLFIAQAVVLEHLDRLDRLQEVLRAARAADPGDPFPVCYGLAVKVSRGSDLETDPGRLSGELLAETVPLVSQSPTSPAPYVLLGVAHLVQGNRPLAEESLAAARARAAPQARPAAPLPDRLTAFLAGVSAADEKFRPECSRFLTQFHLSGDAHGPND